MDRYTELEQWLGTEKARRNESLARHSTFRIGGPADLLCLPETREDLIRLVQLMADRGIPWIALGNGSNILFSDLGFRGIVVKVRGGSPTRGTLWDIEQTGDYVWAGAGISLARLAWHCAGVGLSGMEWSTGIPGVIGGSIRGNAGAHGWEMGDIIESVEMVIPSGEMMQRRANDMGFAYRRSDLDPRTIITGGTFRMSQEAPDTIRKRIREYTEYRKRSQPSADQSAGCIFKNPDGDSAGRLVDIAGCKGVQVGGAMVSSKHANFIINCGGATAEDTLRLVELVQSRVREQTGVTLEMEVRIVNPEGV